MAAYNAASWCEINIEYPILLKLAREFGWNRKSGIKIVKLDKLLSLLKIPKKFDLRVNPYAIQRELYAGKAYLVGYKSHYDKGGHAIMLFLDKNGKIRLINPAHKKFITWDDLAAEANAGGMEFMVAWELPTRQYVKKQRYDEQRSSKHS